jgi:hypothetical protein
MIGPPTIEPSKMGVNAFSQLTLSIRIAPSFGLLQKEIGLVLASFCPPTISTGIILIPNPIFAMNNNKTEEILRHEIMTTIRANNLNISADFWFMLIFRTEVQLRGIARELHISIKG